MSDQPLTTKAIPAIRLSDAEIDSLLDALDASSAGRNNDRRAHDRYRFRVKNCITHLQQPGSATTLAYSVPTRDLSSGGVSFLHGNFTHTGTKVTVQLISSHGAWQEIEGTVVGCEHVQQLIHHVHVQFNHPIEIELFCPEAVKPRVLLVDDDPILIRVASLYLTRLNADLVTVADGQAAVDEALAHLYDVVLMDMEMPVLDGFQATKTLRERGYSGKIVAATGLTDSAARQKCLDAGCDHYITKPYAEADFRDLLRSLQREPLFSSKAGDKSMRELIDSFVAELPDKLREIEHAFAQSDNTQLEYIARRLKGEAGSYGFEPITEAAAALETGIRGSVSADQIQQRVSALIDWCRLARAPDVAAPG